MATVKSFYLSIQVRLTKAVLQRASLRPETQVLLLSAQQAARGYRHSRHSCLLYAGLYCHLVVRRHAQNAVQGETPEADVYPVHGVQCVTYDGYSQWFLKLVLLHPRYAKKYSDSCFNFVKS